MVPNHQPDSIYVFVYYQLLYITIVGLSDYFLQCEAPQFKVALDSPQ